MKASELRIGNLLRFSGEPVAINAGFIHDCDYWNKNPERQDAVSFENVEPIPLTDEWLEKFGFNKFPNQNKYDMDKFWACKLSNGNEWHFEDLECIVKYVHQLQNLYFALTGEELIIKEESK